MAVHPPCGQVSGESASCQWAAIFIPPEALREVQLPVFCQRRVAKFDVAGESSPDIAVAVNLTLLHFVSPAPRRASLPVELNALSP
jgi:hypothetical protein